MFFAMVLWKRKETQMAIQTKRLTRRGALRILGAASLIGLSSPAAANEDVGHVETVVGNGFAGNAPRRRLRANGPLRMGDRVWTETASHASLMLDLGAVVHMGPQAQVILDRFVAGASGVMTLGEGAMVFDRDEALPKLDFQVRSAFAQIGLRGTRFFAGPNRGVFAIFVERGRVHIAAGGGEVVLQAGEGTDIVAVGARPSEVTRWQPQRIAEAFESVLG